MCCCDWIRLWRKKNRKQNVKQYKKSMRATRKRSRLRSRFVKLANYYPKGAFFLFTHQNCCQKHVRVKWQAHRVYTSCRKFAWAYLYLFLIFNTTCESELNLIDRSGAAHAGRRKNARPLVLIFFLVNNLLEIIY